jgi:hypothetical protein
MYSGVGITISALATGLGTGLGTVFVNMFYNYSIVFKQQACWVFFVFVSLR